MIRIDENEFKHLNPTNDYLKVELLKNVNNFDEYLNENYEDDDQDIVNLIDTLTTRKSSNHFNHNTSSSSLSYSSSSLSSFSNANTFNVNTSTSSVDLSKYIDEYEEDLFVETEPKTHSSYQHRFKKLDIPPNEFSTE